MSDPTQPNEFDGQFEALMIHRLCVSPNFYQSVGRFLRPDWIGAESGKLLVQAAHAIFKDTKSPPSGIPIVFQRIASWVAKGAVTEESHDEAYDYIETALLFGSPTDAVLIAEAVAPIRGMYERDIADVALQGIQQNQSILTNLRKAVAELDSLGKASSVVDSLGTGDDIFGILYEGLCLTRISTGSAELDNLTGGGFVTPSLAFYAADSGGGKSTSLAQAAAGCLLSRRNVAIRTLELNKGMWGSRFMGCLTNVQIDPLMELLPSTKAAFRVARERYEQMAPTLGNFSLSYSSAVTIREMRQWVDSEEQVKGIKFDEILIDYGGLIVAPSEKEGYGAGKVIYEEFRGWMFDEKRAGVTAEQATRKAGMRAHIGKDDIADSQNKIRTCDMAISNNITVTDQNEELLEQLVIKNRFGKAGLLGPRIATDFEYGRTSALLTPWKFQKFTRSGQYEGSLR